VIKAHEPIKKQRHGFNRKETPIQAATNDYYIRKEGRKREGGASQGRASFAFMIFLEATTTAASSKKQHLEM